MFLFIRVCAPSSLHKHTSAEQLCDGLSTTDQMFLRAEDEQKEINFLRKMCVCFNQKAADERVQQKQENRGNKTLFIVYL